jgi:threonine synthase
MFNCPHTGAALAALRKLVARGIIRSDDRVVVISTAHGLKFADQKTAYHQGTLPGITPSHANRPVDLEPDLRRVEAAIAGHVERAQLRAG